MTYFRSGGHGFGELLFFLIFSAGSYLSRKLSQPSFNLFKSCSSLRFGISLYFISEYLSVSSPDSEIPEGRTYLTHL